MFHRLLFTIATASCLTGVYAVYAVVTRPLVVIPEMPTTSHEPTQRAIAHRPMENVRIAETYLPQQPWAAQSKYMLRSGQAFIYTTEWSHKEGDPRIRFAPFAMVWLQKDKEGHETAVSMVSDSAQLKFASAFDEVNPNPGRVVGAVLDGEVQVKGPDGLEIVGKQFVFDESAPSLVSANPVRFQYGSHRGRGRTLNMKLIPAEGPPGRDRPHVYGVRTIRLGSGTDPETKKFEQVQLDVRMPQQGQQQLVQVRCSGDLEYDVLSHTAHFSQAVRANRRTGGAGYDSLDCDDLWLQFEPAPAKVVTATGDEHEAEPNTVPDDTNRTHQHIETDLVFRRMTAKGQKVNVASTQNNLRADMKSLIYDAVERRLQLVVPRKLTVLQQGYLVEMKFEPDKQNKGLMPEIDVRLTEEHAPDEVYCHGVGELEMTRADTNELAYVVSWARQLHKSTDRTNGLDVIDLQQQASFRQPRQHTGLGAELIRLWLAPLALRLPGERTAKQPAPSPEVQPKRLVAARAVAMVSPQLVARTDELEVIFEEPTGPPRALGQQSRDGLQLVALEVEQPAAPSHPRAARVPLRSRDSTAPQGRVQTTNFTSPSGDHGSLGPPIRTSPANDNAGRARLTGPGGEHAEPPDVKADRINVRMRRIMGQPEPELMEVETQGHVRIVQRRPNGEAPMTAEGDRLHLQNNGKLREIVHLFGQPAHLRDRAMGLHVEGREIHMDRESNKVWVKGAGLLQLPVPPGTEIESLGQAADDPDLDVWWQESMVFDGQTAKFIGKVRSELGLGQMRCEQMDVKLSTRLSFADPKVDQKPELTSIECREDVSFDSSKYEGNKLTWVQRGRVAEFRLDRQNGTTFAQGPGHMKVWQRGKGNQAGLAPRDVIQANRPISAVTSDWDFTRVDFKGRMTGYIDRQQSTFYDSVMIVHGPVNLPNESIDPDHLPSSAGSMRCEELWFAHQSKTAAHPNGFQQLVGKRNAQIEGRGFYANADEISFDGSKGLYMLRAHGNQSAMIAQDTEQGPRREASGRRIEFIPATRTVKVDWATGATGGP